MVSSMSRMPRDHLSNNLIVGTCRQLHHEHRESPPAACTSRYPNTDNFLAQHRITSSQMNSGPVGGPTDTLAAAAGFGAKQVERRVRPHHNGALTEEKVTKAILRPLVAAIIRLPAHGGLHRSRMFRIILIKAHRRLLAHVRYNLTKRTVTVLQGPHFTGHLSGIFHSCHQQRVSFAYEEG